MESRQCEARKAVARWCARSGHRRERGCASALCSHDSAALKQRPSPELARRKQKWRDSSLANRATPEADPLELARPGGCANEGICDADLFIKPSWRAFIPSQGMGADGTLTAANANKACHHLLVAGHRPEMDCATRHLGDGWTLYTSTRPYSPSNPFSEMQFQAGGKSPRTILRSGWDDD